MAVKSGKGKSEDKSLRGNDYYARRLKEEHPLIFKEVLAGGKTLSDAFRESGLRKERTRFHEMRNGWDKASPSERDDFMRHAGLMPVAACPGLVTSSRTPKLTPNPSAASTTGALAFHHDRHLTSEGKDALRRFMQDRGFGGKTGKLMQLMGRSALDASVGIALRRDTKLDKDLLHDLEQLLGKYGFWP